MAIFNQWPWTNFREYNLDWVIRTVKSCQETVASALEDVSDAVSQYFADHIDTTLSVSGDAADAAAVGNRITSIYNGLNVRMNSAESSIITLQDITKDLYIIDIQETTNQDDGTQYVASLQPFGDRTAAQTFAYICTRIEYGYYPRFLVRDVNDKYIAGVVSGFTSGSNAITHFTVHTSNYDIAMTSETGNAFIVDPVCDLYGTGGTVKVKGVYAYVDKSWGSPQNFNIIIKDPNTDVYKATSLQYIGSTHQYVIYAASSQAHYIVDTDDTVSEAQ